MHHAWSHMQHAMFGRRRLLLPWGLALLVAVAHAQQQGSGSSSWSGQTFGCVDGVEQDGCSQHEEQSKALCVTTNNKKYKRCKEKKNKDGYSIKTGVVTRCAKGKKMAAGADDSDACTANCTVQAGCGESDSDALCVGSNLDMLRCKAGKNLAGYAVDDSSAAIRCGKGEMLAVDTAAIACISTDQIRLVSTKAAWAPRQQEEDEIPMFGPQALIEPVDSTPSPFKFRRGSQLFQCIRPDMCDVNTDEEKRKYEYEPPGSTTYSTTRIGPEQCGTPTQNAWILRMVADGGSFSTTEYTHIFEYIYKCTYI